MRDPPIHQLYRPLICASQWSLACLQVALSLEVMSYAEHFTPTLALHHQQLVQNSILAGHAVGGATYKLRCQIIPHPVDGGNSGSLILTLLLVDNTWQLGGVSALEFAGIGRLTSP
jgi:hypothetical protein